MLFATAAHFNQALMLSFVFGLLVIICLCRHYMSVCFTSFSTSEKEVKEEEKATLKKKQNTVTVILRQH